MSRDLDLIRQRVEILDGSRRLGDRGRAAVRVEDMSALLSLPVKLKSLAVTASPTPAQFNLLVEDVHEIHQRVLALAAAIQVRHGRPGRTGQ